MYKNAVKFIKFYKKRRNSVYLYTNAWMLASIRKRGHKSRFAEQVALIRQYAKKRRPLHGVFVVVQWPSASIFFCLLSLAAPSGRT